jgi:glycosyltransferase involved in cell wall biosynthesis
MQASVVIRARDEAGAIGRTLDRLAAQTAAHEVIVVDSGSRDGTEAIAAGRDARVLTLEPARFTFGRALNAGCAEAGAPVICWALSRELVCVLDPALAVEHDHRREPLRARFRRWEREHRGFALFLELPPYRPRDALAEWWGDQGWHRSRARARLDLRRVARLAGKWWGRR